MKQKESPTPEGASSASQAGWFSVTWIGQGYLSREELALLHENGWTLQCPGCGGDYLVINVAGSILGGVGRLKGWCDSCGLRYGRLREDFPDGTLLRLVKDMISLSISPGPRENAVTLEGNEIVEFKTGGVRLYQKHAAEHFDEGNVELNTRSGELKIADPPLYCPMVDYIEDFSFIAGAGKKAGFNFSQEHLQVVLVADGDVAWLREVDAPKRVHIASNGTVLVENGRSKNRHPGELLAFDWSGELILCDRYAGGISCADMSDDGTLAWCEVRAPDDDKEIMLLVYDLEEGKRLFKRAALRRHPEEIHKTDDGIALTDCDGEMYRFTRMGELLSCDGPSDEAQAC